MKIIIDTDKKELVLIGSVSLSEINAFCVDHNLQGYSISSTDTSTHWYRGWVIDPVDPLAPPYKITSTGDPVVSIPGSTCAADNDLMDEAIKFGYQRIDPSKHHGVDPKGSRKIIGMREDDTQIK